EKNEEEFCVLFGGIYGYGYVVWHSSCVSGICTDAVGYRAPKAAHTALSNAINAAISVLLSFQNFAEEDSEEYSSEEYSSEEYSSEEYISEEYISEEYISEESSTYEHTDEEYPDEDCNEYCLESIIADVLALIITLAKVPVSF
ncbi:MAG: hypothetical protein FWF81_07590, partial [Defluviitaleaceae bacterium]|nr:hypothetical protein [Defluviitaleaceae bacterium]